MAHRLDEDDKRRIGEKLDAGTLIDGIRSTVFGGKCLNPGDCSGCGKAIRKGDMEIEVQTSDGSRCCFHAVCHDYLLGLVALRAHTNAHES